MSAIPYREFVNAQTHGLGFWQVIAGIVGPLAEAGASAYSTYADSETAKRTSKSQKVELEALMKQRTFEAELEAVRDREEAQLRAKQSADRARLAEIALGVGAFVGTTALVVWGVRRLRRGG